MTMPKKSAVLLMGLCIAAMLLPSAGCNRASSDAAKTVDAGATWVVSETTRLIRLDIADGAVVAAPEGRLLTMTVDHVETGIGPGVWEGDIVLTPTTPIPMIDSMHGGEYSVRTAVFVEDGAVAPDKSVLSAVAAGEVTDAEATDLRIVSVGDNFNGFVAMGATTYALQNPSITFTGDGGNDFAGYGAAIATHGKADVTVNNASIVTDGCIRTAVWTGGESTVRVNDSYIETGSPALPEGHLDPFTEGGKVMREVPFMLGLTGTCRSTNLLDKGSAYYTNTHIKAKGWGCLSVDSAEDVTLVATGCTIETVESGYGAYTMGGSVDTFVGCTFNVADMAVVGTGGDCIFTDGTVVNSRRFGVMYHGPGDIVIDKGSEFNTESTAIQLKSPGHDLLVDGARLNPGNGILLQVMANDDPYTLMGPPAEGSITPEGELARGGPPEEMPGEEAASEAPPSDGRAPRNTRSGTHAVFRNVTLAGDIFNGNTPAEPLTVALENATITGAITTTTVVHAQGPGGEKITMETPELYYLIGEVDNTPAPKPSDPHGLVVSLDGESGWVVDKTCYLTGLTLAEGAAITAPEGAGVAMTVDGKETAIGPGVYSGRIVLAVTDRQI
jgi:hypothetical protein